MKKRQLFLDFLKRILIGNDHPAINRPHLTASPTPIDSNESDQKTFLPLQGDYSSPQPVVSIKSPPMNLSRDKDPAPNMSDFPPVSEEIKELLGSSDWEEVNQGLELLAASCGTEQIKAFAQLIDASGLSIRSQSVWQAVLGIDEKNQLNAAAKLAGLSGALAGVRTIALNSINFADSEIHLNLDLLSEASDLQELVINGIELSSLGALSSLNKLQKLVLISNSIDWDSDKDSECLSSLSKLSFLAVSNWPWEDLKPLSACKALEHLDLRGGELESLQGVNTFSMLQCLKLSEIYSVTSLDGIEKLPHVHELFLSDLDIESISQLSNFAKLQRLTLKTGRVIDISPLGGLPSLKLVDYEWCQDDSVASLNLGSLASCPELTCVNLCGIPTYIAAAHGIEEDDEGTTNYLYMFGEAEFANLMKTWGGMRTPAAKASSSHAELGDMGVFLLGLNLFELLAHGPGLPGNDQSSLTESMQINIDEFRFRFDQIASRFSNQIASRCYWLHLEGAPVGQSHPLDRMIKKSRQYGCLDSDEYEKVCKILSDRLPKAPIR